MIQHLQWITNLLVIAPVRMAKERGYLRSWRSDVGADATPVGTLASHAKKRRGLASREITAGWHKSGGTGLPTFGYSGHLLVAASSKQLSRTFPQLCLGMVLDTPNQRTGQNAVTLLKQLQQLGVPVGDLAADRAYPYCKPEDFQVPARKLGYRLAFDYKRRDRGDMPAHEGDTPIVDGCLACPLMPAPHRRATQGLSDKQARNPSDELKTQLAARDPFFLHIKQHADHRGAIRVQCPAAGPSPTVQCGRHDRLHPGTTRRRDNTVDLRNTRRRATHPAAKPLVPIPHHEQEHPPAENSLPRICRHRTMTVHAHESAKFRQDYRYLTDSWFEVYKPIRAHNEGLNGRLKSLEVDIGNRKHRGPVGQVAQTILLAIMLLIGNIKILAGWLKTRHGCLLDDAAFSELAPLQQQCNPAVRQHLRRTEPPP